MISQEVGAVWLSVCTLVDVAEWALRNGEPAFAVQLLNFAVSHPAIVADAKENGQKRLDELTDELPAERIAEAERAAQSHTLDSLVAALLSSTCDHPDRSQERIATNNPRHLLTDA
ncbi:hypothetical protein KFU94_40195 [Chloroflexi bacterium TSY]|nr:hypothetical protein [Chloroflexi bacterium TSY]